MAKIPRQRPGGQPGRGNHSQSKFQSIQRGGRPSLGSGKKTNMNKGGCAVIAFALVLLPFIVAGAAVLS